MTTNDLPKSTYLEGGQVTVGKNLLEVVDRQKLALLLHIQ